MRRLPANPTASMFRRFRSPTDFSAVRPTAYGRPTDCIRTGYGQHFKTPMSPTRNGLIFRPCRLGGTAPCPPTPCPHLLAGHFASGRLGFRPCLCRATELAASGQGLPARLLPANRASAATGCMDIDVGRVNAPGCAARGEDLPLHARFEGDAELECSHAACRRHELGNLPGCSSNWWEPWWSELYRIKEELCFRQSLLLA